MVKIGQKVKIKENVDIEQRGMTGIIVDDYGNHEFPIVVEIGKKRLHFKEDELEFVKLRVYLAGPFFNERQIKLAKKVEAALEMNETIDSFFSPRLHQDDPTLEMFTPAWAKVTMENDVKEIEKADIVLAIVDFDEEKYEGDLAYYEARDTDSGTAWELGYAIAKGMPTFLVHFKNEGMVNIMLTERNTAFFTDEKQIEKYNFTEQNKIPFTGDYR